MILSRPLHPAVMMILFWVLIFLVYFFGPISLTPKVSLLGVMFLVFHILMFVLGSTLFVRISFFKNHTCQVSSKKYMSDSQKYKLFFLVLLIGICGGLVAIYCKLIAVEGLSFSSITSLRTQRAQSLLAGGQIQSGYLSAIAFLTYPAGFVGLVASLLFYEKMPRYIKIALCFYVLTIICVAICSGGRSPILVLLLFVGISCYARKIMGKSFMPRSAPLRLVVMSLMLLFVVYSSFMWTIRAKESGMSTNVMLEYAANVWGAKPKAYLLSASEWLEDPKFTQTVLSSTFYIIQSLSITERLLLSPDEVPTLYGAYHIDLIAAMLRTFPDGGDFLKSGYERLMNANIYGYFTGAWSALFIDFWIFSFLAAAIWGFLAGKSWLNFKRNPNLSTGINYVFWTYTILISFVSPPFGFSNSFMIFMWFVFFAFTTRLRIRYLPIQRERLSDLTVM